jgi:hypothetical protein
MYLWRYNRVTGYWVQVRRVEDATAEEWLRIYREDDQGTLYVVSKRRPRTATYPEI